MNTVIFFLDTVDHHFGLIRDPRLHMFLPAQSSIMTQTLPSRVSCVAQELELCWLQGLLRGNTRGSGIFITFLKPFLYSTL